MRILDVRRDTSRDRSRGRLRRLIGATVAIVLLATGLSVAGVAGAPSASALDGSSFDAGNIISDAVFFDSSTLDAATVQSFLSSHGSSCRGTAALPCLKDFSQDTPARAATRYCSAYPGGSAQSAARIIVDVGVACGINPQVLLVMLQKEQGLIDASSTTAYMYRSALGYGCPDTAACDSTYYGFFNQVYAASAQFQSYTKNSTSWSYQPGRFNNILYNPNASCGSSPVYIQNQATANLYIYTPYQPNAAALANLRGSGDGCSAYGNRNFWVYFNTWFGDPLAGGGLRNGSFESGGAYWGPGNGEVNRAAYSDKSVAHGGAGFFASNTTVAGRSIAQDIARTTRVGDQVTATIWLRSSTDSTFTGQVNVWGLGGTTESASTPYSVGSSWTQVTVKLPLYESEHSTIRLEVYMTSTTGTLFFDDAAVDFGAAPTRHNLLTSPGFEGALGNWAPGNGEVNRVAYNGASTAHSGSWFAAANTDTPGRSLAQVVTQTPIDKSRYSFSIWMKSSDPAREFSGRLVLWGLGSEAPISNATGFSVSGSWKKVTVTTDMTAAGITMMKPEIYLDTPGLTVFVDDGQLSRNLLVAGSFEGPSFSKWGAGVGTINQAVYSSATTGIPAQNGGYFAATNTVTSGSSLAQEVTRQTFIGDTYTADVYLRSADLSKKFSGTLAIWGLGGANEVATKQFSVGSSWTRVTVSLPLSQLHSSLKIEIYESSTDTTLFVDGAQVY